jgi:hypothetical protein
MRYALIKSKSNQENLSNDDKNIFDDLWKDMPEEERLLLDVIGKSGKVDLGQFIDNSDLAKSYNNTSELEVLLNERSEEKPSHGKKEIHIANSHFNGLKNKENVKLYLISLNLHKNPWFVILIDRFEENVPLTSSLRKLYLAGSLSNHFGIDVVRDECISNTFLIRKIDNKSDQILQDAFFGDESIVENTPKKRLVTLPFLLKIVVAFSLMIATLLLII